MMKKRLAAIVILGLVFAPTAWADKGGGKGGGAEKHHKQGKDHAEKGHRHEGHGRGSISVEQRGIIHDYYRYEYLDRGNCPPGLAKKGNGCLPPGQAKKRWAVGQPLPANVVIQPLPPELIIRLGLPPSGHAWGYVDGNIVLYNLVGRMVVDLVGSLF